jgi:hypothetical protein
VRFVYASHRRATANTSATADADDEAVIHAIHKELVDWRRDMPFPLPTMLHPQPVPHLCSSWFDLNYYTHVAMLYRPSPLLPTPSAPRVSMLANAAACAIRQASAMHRQRRLAYNWLNLLSVYTLTLALIYATTARPDSLPAVLADTGAVDDLRLAVELFETLSAKFSAAGRIKRMVEEIIGRYSTLHNPG